MLKTELSKLLVSIPCSLVFSMDKHILGMLWTKVRVTRKNTVKEVKVSE